MVSHLVDDCTNPDSFPRYGQSTNIECIACIVDMELEMACLNFVSGDGEVTSEEKMGGNPDSAIQELSTPLVNNTQQSNNSNTNSSTMFTNSSNITNSNTGSTKSANTTPPQTKLSEKQSRVLLPG